MVLQAAKGMKAKGGRFAVCSLQGFVKDARGGLKGHRSAGKGRDMLEMNQVPGKGLLGN